ncbi:beta-galactosidase, partial [Bacteroidota bacterium]
TYSASVKRKLEPGSNIFHVPLEIKNPELWWPWDLGEQNLYVVDVSVNDSESGFQDREKTTIGIRELEMAMNPGWTKDQVENPWTVMINGRRHFMRSGTWGGPPDLFYGRSYPQKYKELIRLAKEANMNNLRIFNWHPAEIPLFYELCDEAGITVWQDLVPLSGRIPDTPEWKEAVFNEAISVIKQKRNNPSLVLIEGGEEILYTSSDSMSEQRLRFANELGEVLKPYSKLFYIPTSPLSDHNGQKLGFKTNESIHAHTPHYGVGQYLMEDYYRSLDYAAIPELAITSCPNVESIKKFIPEDELWPPGPSWGYHWADLDILRAHNYEILGEQFADSFEDFVEATQISQGTYFQYSLEHFRTRKPKSSAICFCHYILNTPDFKWATVDYYLQPKKSHYYIQRAYQPLLVTLQVENRRWLPGDKFKGNIWVVNDYYTDYKDCTVEIKFLDQDNKVFKQETLKIGDVTEDSSTDFAEVSCEVPGKLGDKFYAELAMLDNKGKKISSNQYLFLVADREEALATLKKMGEEMRQRSRMHGGSTYRYFREFYWEDDYIKTEAIEEFK